MAVDGYLNFDTKINVKGFSNGIGTISAAAERLKSVFGRLAATVSAAFEIGDISAFVRESKKLWQVQLEAETKLETVLGRNLGATEEQIQAVKDWAGELQKVGVIGDEVQLSGLQELATYVENADSLRNLNVVLNDMLAQQYGLNATAENAATVATMLGKVLNGQTTALSRYGYAFTEAQADLLRFGTEEQRVATLAEVVESSVGGVNQALAATSAGRLKQVENALGDIKELFGKAFTNVQAAFVPALEKMTELLEKSAKIAVQASENLAAALGINTKTYVPQNSAEIPSAEEISDSAQAQESFATAVEKNANAQEKAVAGFDEINTLSRKTAENSTSEETREITFSTTVDKSADTQADSLSERLQALVKPIKIAWDANAENLVQNAENALKNLHELGKSVVISFVAVWENGSGERLVSGVLRLFTDVFGVVGDIAAALRTAWDEGGRGEALVQSLFDRWSSFLELIHAVSAAFRTAWNGGAGVEICADMLEIFTNLNYIATNLRTNFTAAWNENQTGVRIFEALLKIVKTISGTFSRLAKSTAQWAENLDFTPFLQSVENLLNAVEPLTASLGDGLVLVYENALLPLATWTINAVIPQFLYIFAAALKVVTAVVNALKPLGKWLFESFLKPLAAWTGGAIVKILGAVANALLKISDWVAENRSVFEAFALIIGSFAAGFAITSLITSVTAALAGMGGVVGILSGAFSALTAAVNPVGLAIGAVIAVSVLLIKNWDNIAAALSKAWEAIKLSFAEAWESVKAVWKIAADWFASLWNSIVAAFAEAWNSIKSACGSVVEFFSEIWDGIKSVFLTVGEWFLNIFLTAWDNIALAFGGAVKFFGTIWENIKKIYITVAKWYGSIFLAAWNAVKTVWGVAVEFFNEIWDGIKSTFATVGEWFRGVFSAAWDNIALAFDGAVEFFGEIWDGIKFAFATVGEWFRGIFSAAWDNIALVFGGAVEFFRGIWGGITGIFGSVGSWFRDKFQAAYDGITEIFGQICDFFSGIWEGISNGAKDGVNWISEKLNSLLERLETGINGIINGINGAFSFHIPDNKITQKIGIADESFSLNLPNVSLPRIPYLAQGTVVPANFGDFLAVLGDNKREPEIVAPESAIRRAVAAELKANGQQIPHDIVVNTYLYPNSSAYRKEIVKIVNEERARRGV